MPNKTTEKKTAPAKAKAAPKKTAPKKTDEAAAPKVPVAVKEVKKTALAKKEGNYFYASGKRKTAVANVRIYSEGNGSITINERSFENFFPVMTDQDKILSPLRMTGNLKGFDISVKVFGGGVHSQAEAIRHGISKALLAFNVALRSTLKPAGLLTRDSRIKERKKYGLKRARRAPQWQKR
ncbi:MAG: 30S ribosomal protein S9 [Candidatus Peregrinibacteria bacterium GW2011_GWA2_47_7]|nr:MAG: 30S ribosomal protein S9 [Candidatus Peregrinibacteria bacterium GW2011_GWA2_47_7]